MKQIKSIIITACILLPSMSYGMMQRFAQKPNSALGAMRQHMAKIYQMPRSQKLAAARAYVAKPALQTKLKAAAMLSGAGLAMAHTQKMVIAEESEKSEYTFLFLRRYDNNGRLWEDRQTTNFDTQSEAHASLDCLSVDGYFWSPDVEQRCVERERALKDTHFVFYHSQPYGVMIVQDVLRALYELEHGVELREDFVFLRCPWDERLQELTDVNTFLDKYHPIVKAGEQDALWAGRACCSFDGTGARPSQLVSANVSLYGCQSKNDDCTVAYCTKGKTGGTGPNISALLSRVFVRYDLDFERAKDAWKFEKMTVAAVGNAFIEDLSRAFSFNGVKQLHALSRWHHHSLLPIFIPKNSVDKCVYAARGYGCPYNKPIVPECFDATRGRHTKISPILEKYKTTPASFVQQTMWDWAKYKLASRDARDDWRSGARAWTPENAADRMQARILMTPEILDPKSNVIIYEEPMMSREERLKIRAEVKAIVKKAWDRRRMLERTTHPDCLLRS